MLQLINDTTGTYRLTIEYKEREYKYTARRITFDVGIETWFVWAKNGLLQLKYNTATKELKQDLLSGQKQSIPEDFMEVLQESFANRV